MQWKDPIVETIHEIRRLRDAQFKDDWNARYQDWKRKERLYGEKGYHFAELPVKRESKKAA